MTYDHLCIKCGKNAVDLRYFWNAKLNTYEIEYHCTTIHGFNGCGLYRIIPMNFNFTEEEEE